MSTVGVSLLIPIVIEGKPTLAVVDTAAQITMVSDQFWATLTTTIQVGPSIRIRNAEASSYMNCVRYSQVCLQFGNLTFHADLAVGPISDNVILGLDFLLDKKAVIDLVACVVYLGETPIPAQMVRGHKSPSKKAISSHQVAVVYASGDQYLAPMAVQRVAVKLSNDASVPFVTTPASTTDIIIASCLIQGGNDPQVIEVMNDSAKTVFVKDGDILAGAVEAEVTESPGLSVARAALQEEGQDGESKTILEQGSELPSVTKDLDNLIASCPSRSTEALLGILPEVVQDLFKRSLTNLDERERVALAMILREYADTFATAKEDLGKFDLIQHQITTTDEVPVRERMRRTPIKFVDEEEKTLQSMLEAGVIKPSTSAWASAPVLVRKKDGEVRYTVDYRKLNAKTVKDVYPLPLISECMDALDGTMWFHTLDLASGYWQIVIDPKDAHKTAFLTRHGLFEHVRLAQGLCNAPATFQRVMHLVLRGLTWNQALVYLDDVIVLGKDFPNAIENLEMVLQRFRAHNLKLKPKKCHLFGQEVIFLGRRISRLGVSVSDEHIHSVKEWPAPRDVEELQRFLGFINYHREFIPNLSKVAAPLFSLTRKNSAFKWGPECQAAFDTLKTAMSSPPILTFPNNRDPFILDTDASDVALGACLYQVQDGRELPVSYSSALLSPAQRRYCTTRKELLAIVLFTRQYRHYLLGSKFTVRTDHHSLAWLFKFKDCSGQLGRWLEELSQYALVIQHRPGSRHGNADAMSRIPAPEKECNCYQAGHEPAQLPCGGCAYCRRMHTQWSRFEEDVDYVVPLGVRAIAAVGCDPNESLTELHGYGDKELEQHQRRDPALFPIFKWLEEPPSQAALQLQGHKTKALWRNKDHLILKNGVLYYKWFLPDSSTIQKLVVPDNLRAELLQLAHDSKGGGHWGRPKTLGRLQQSFYWPGRGKDVDLHIKTCATCSVNKGGLMPRKALQTYQAGEPNERVHLDFLGPFETSLRGNKYILSIVDQFTRWIEIYPLPEQSAATTANVFLEGWICRFGVPKIVHTDQGRNFTSQLFQHLCQYLECVKTRTTPYRPCSNGQVERYNRMILSFIRCFLLGRDKEWDLHLPILCMSLRSTINRTTGYTANLLQLGREVRMPWDIAFGISHDTHTDNISEFLREKLDCMQKTFAATRENIQAAQRVQKCEYDRRSPLRNVDFDVGDLVYTINTSTPVGKSHKLQPILKGPFVIVKALTPFLYVARDHKKAQVFHHDRLRLCEDREVPLWVHRVRKGVLDPNDTIEDELSPVDSGTDLGLELYNLFSTPQETIPTVDVACEDNTGETDAPNSPAQAQTQFSRRGRAVIAPAYLRDYVHH